MNKVFLCTDDTKYSHLHAIAKVSANKEISGTTSINVYGNNLFSKEYPKIPHSDPGK
jgi:hypothetical protein